MKFILSFIGVICLTGCATSYSTGSPRDGKPGVVYQLNEAQALSFIAVNMAISFPSHRIKKIEGPVKGYQARFRFLADTWDTSVLAVPVTGVTQNGRAVKGYRFDVNGSGTLIISGRGKTNNFRDRLISDLNQSGTGIPVVKAVPIM
ncbi:MAG TPA: hypothetical protein VNQ90_18035 [Chthoniobacteraceae bacterium]|nr:hypothetical protein [Chthoniobacteraceae bacterium]